jgi:acetyl-CoA carboxylase carboxyltransferase component
MTARERIDYLLDAKSKSIEIGAFAGDGIRRTRWLSVGWRGDQNRLHQRQTMYRGGQRRHGKAGAWFPITGKKNLRAQEIAMENRLPIITL